MKYMVGKIIIRTGLYLAIAMIVFLNIVNLMQFPKSESLVERAEKIELVEQKINTIDDKEVILSEIINTKEKNSEVENASKSFIFFDYVLENNNIVIPLIYLMTLLTFLLQAVLLSLSNYYKELTQFIDEKKLDAIFLYSSEWAINAPPVLGVVGTIFSFGMVVSNLSDMSSLSTVFKDNFANAALTTIIGGSIYVLNLLTNIFIAKNLSK